MSHVELKIYKYDYTNIDNCKC